MQIMPQVEPDLVLDSLWQIMPSLDQPIVLLIDDLPGRGEDAMARGRPLDRGLLAGHLRIDLLASNQEFRPLVPPRDLAVDRSDIVPAPRDGLERRVIGIDPGPGDDLVQRRLPGEPEDQDVALGDQSRPRPGERLRRLTEIAADSDRTSPASCSR